MKNLFNYFKHAKHLKALKIPKLWRQTEGEGVTVLVTGSGFGSWDEANEIFTPHIYSGDVENCPPAVTVWDTFDHRGHEAPAISLINGQQKGSKWVGIAPKAKVYAMKTQDFKRHPVTANDIDPYAVIGLQKCLDWYHTNPFDILNCSWNVNEPQELGIKLIKELAELGVIIVISANNWGQDNPQPYAHLKDYVISVGATDYRGNVVPWSNRNCDFYVPGESIVAHSWQDPSQYSYVGGTSFSAPILSGLIALLINKDRKMFDVFNGLEKLDLIKLRLKKYFNHIDWVVKDNGVRGHI